jgi:hypothetical protein
MRKSTPATDTFRALAINQYRQRRMMAKLHSGRGRTMTLNLRQLVSLLVGLFAFTLSVPAMAWELAGNKIIKLHTRDGSPLRLDTLTSHPREKKATSGSIWTAKDSRISFSP